MIRWRLSARERKLALLVGIGAPLWGLVNGVGLPLWDRLTQLDQQAQAAQRKLDRLVELAARKPAIERAYGEHADLFVSAEESMEHIQRAFLDDLERLARAEQLQIDLRPKLVQDHRQVSRISVEVTIEATQEAALAFVDQVLKLPRLVELERLRIATTVSQERPLRVNLIVNHVVIRTRGENNA